MVTAVDLLSKGYFPEQVIPPLNAKKLSDILPHLLPNLSTYKPFSSKCCSFSVPKTNNYRRFFSIPNPLHQTRLCVKIEENWTEIVNHLKKSKISLIHLDPDPTSIRAFDRSSMLKQKKKEEILRSTSSRCVLISDISNFYSTIYTHSIPWALHGKEEAKKRKKDPELLGNILDQNVRYTQDQQTMGIPVGPDTSHIISEIIGSAIDIELIKKNPRLKRKGYRYVDDFGLFFSDWSIAESVQHDLEKILKYYELQPNANKTRIIDLPQPIEPQWVTDLRLFAFRSQETYQESDLINYFSKVFYLSKKNPHQNVMKYAIKRIKDYEINPDNWELFESLLLKSIIAESTCMPVVTNLLYKYKYLYSGYPVNYAKRIQETIDEIIIFHSPFSHGYEVSWALWCAKTLNLKIGKRATRHLNFCDDPIVTLISLDMQANKLLDNAEFDTSFLIEYMTADNLYDDHWLITYEALVKKWLKPFESDDYVKNDPFFSVLSKNNVQFYDEKLTESGIQISPMIDPYAV